jgi:hypothetical protein
MMIKIINESSGSYGALYYRGLDINRPDFVDVDSRLYIEGMNRLTGEDPRENPYDVKVPRYDKSGKIITQESIRLKLIARGVLSDTGTLNVSKMRELLQTPLTKETQNQK